MDHSLLLPLLLAVHVPEGVIWAGIPTVLAAVGAGIKLLWNYWTKQQDKKDSAVQAQIDQLQELVTLLRQEATAREAKIAQREMQHSVKVEQLMMLAMNKVEEWGEKNRELQKEFTETAAEFTDLARRFGLEEE